jgi:hypothetical protein
MSGKKGQHRNSYAKPYFFYQKHDPIFTFGGGNDPREKEKAVKLAKYKRNKNA